MHQFDFKEICEKFNIYGDFIRASLFGSGHINGTFKVIYSQAGTLVPYIFQMVNTEVFKDPYALMENIERVLYHLKTKYEGKSRNLTSRVLTLVPMKHGGYLYQDKHGNFWRAFFCIEDMSTYDVLENENMAYEGAKAFGRFQNNLSDLPKPRLHDTIPDFHNTIKRFKTLEKAIEADVGNRAVKVKKEINECVSRINYAGKLYELYNEDRIPERICHNDTKLNNVMIDNDSGEGMCVLDLDTVMPGFVAYDFGDMMRTGTCFAEEDETDLSKVVIDMNMFKAIATGYIEEANKFLTRTEKDNLVIGGLIITLEMSVRFLTDYLQKDIYFKIHRPKQNIDRTRAQLRLVKEMEHKYDEMCNIVSSL